MTGVLFACSFPFVVRSLSGFGIKVMWPNKISLEVFPLLLSSGRDYREWVQSLKCLVEFTSEIIWASCFLF